jgi:hypothetical protein
MLSPDMAKLSSEKIVQETNHRWRSPLYSKKDMTRPVVHVDGGKPFSILFTFVLVPSASTSSASRHPDIPETTSAPPNPKQDLMHFDLCDVRTSK